MFSPFLIPFRPTHLRPSHLCPPPPLLCHPKPGDRRFRPCRKGSAFSRPLLTTTKPLFAHSLHYFSTAPHPRTHSNTRNSNPLRRLLHNSRHTPGEGADLGTGPSFNSNQDGVSLVIRWLASTLERPIPTIERQVIITIPCTISTYAKHARNPFRIRTSKTQDLKSFRIRTYEKRGRGVPPILSPLGSPPS
jgi:hypothetical protein